MELSILIPARNEEFLAKTVEDALSHIEADTEIIVGLDGQWANPPIPQHERVIVVYYPESIGQRAMTNQLCKLSKAKYVMKVDAHCSFDQGFDRKLIKSMQDDWTMVPVMRNLYAFDWVCECGFKHYQDKGSICPQCTKEMKKEMVWKAKDKPNSTAFSFDSEPHFQYHNEYKKKQEGDIVETMSLQGSCFMLTRDKYWELNISDEAMGSWGSQGIEVACKTWLSGGRVVCNRTTWYAHMFRTKSANGFGFPYQQDQNQIDGAKAKARDLFFNSKFDKAIRPLSWLVEKFWPITPSEKNKGWTKEALDALKKSEQKMV